MSSPRKYMREYMNKRRKTDEEFNRRQRRHTIKYNKRIAEEDRALIAEFKSRGCSFCPEKEPCCMSAHHLRDKKFLIAAAINRHISPKTLKEELKKCICVCENCHRKIHAGILKLPSK